jgi:type II secretory pathway pseudopilin PulG
MQNNSAKFKIKNSQVGLTLTELVVVMAVFVMLISLAVSLFVSIIQHQKRILEEQELSSQVSYAMEYISRALRAAAKDQTGFCLAEGGVQHPGYQYWLTRYDAATGFYKGIKVINQSNNSWCYEFFLDTDGILKEINAFGVAQNLLSNKFTVKYARFVINGNKALQGALPSDAVQPRITILLDIQIPNSSQKKIIQTTISQRNLNL